MAKENLEAASERLQKALDQLQSTVDGVFDKVERELSGSAAEKASLHDERKNFEARLHEVEEKYADLHAVAQTVSNRLTAICKKARNILDG